VRLSDKQLSMRFLRGECPAPGWKKGDERPPSRSPFRVFGCACWISRHAVADHPLMELAARLKFCRRSVPPSWVRGPTMPLAVSSALWSSAAGRACHGRSTSSGFAFLQSIPQAHLAGPLRAADSSPGLSIPFSTHQARRSTGLVACLTTFVPPSGFGYPLDGLLPSSPSGPSRGLAALLGFSPSKHSAHRAGRRFRRPGPTCRSSGV
jgi:hypothetical protein